MASFVLELFILIQLHKFILNIIFIHKHTPNINDSTILCHSVSHRFSGYTEIKMEGIIVWIEVFNGYQIFQISMKLTSLRLERLPTETDCYLLAKFTKLTVLNLIKLGPWEVGSFVKISFRLFLSLKKYQFCSRKF